MKKAISIIMTLIGGMLLQSQNTLSAGLIPTLSVSITDPTGPVAFGEMPEYATLVWNDPWDMSQALDVRQIDSPQCNQLNHFNPYTPCSEGIWCGQVRAGSTDPYLYLLHPGFRDSLHVGRDGNLRPINAAYYTQLTFRMYLSSVDPNDPGFMVYWTNGTDQDIGTNPSRYGSSHFYKTYAGWNIYTIDLSQETAPPDGALPWTGQLTGLRLDPGMVNMGGKVVMLDWVRLSPRQTRQVRWSTSGTGSIKIKLQSAASTDELRMYRIVSTWTEPVSIPATQGFYDVPASLPPGDWYVQLELNGQNSAPAGPWQIQAAPTLRFTKPSYTSGEDYATVNLGRAWDMNVPGEVYSYYNTTAPTFSDGILTSTSLDTNPVNTCSGYWEDPYIFMLDDNYWDPPYTTSPPIDTAKYRYLTFRVKLDGTPDLGYGWGARVGWADFLSQNCGITNDLPLLAGWNEYSIDLWAGNIVEPDEPNCRSPWRASSQRRQLRFDPTESPVAITWHLDYIRLTANDTAQRNSTFQIKYLLNKTAGVSVTFYYDTDTNPANGRTLANQMVSSSSGPYKVYLPFIVNSSQSQNNPAERVFNWNLAGVPPGTYYISADVNDGYQTTTWYSETPMIVKP